MATEDRVRQVETTKKTYGENHYKAIGSRGGKNSPSKFTSESAKAASKARWDIYREKHKGTKDET